MLLAVELDPTYTLKVQLVCDLHAARILHLQSHSPLHACAFVDELIVEEGFSMLFIYTFSGRSTTTAGTISGLHS